MVIQLDLSKQQYQVFNVDIEPTLLELKNKNFIFGKNGTGKSTLCKMMENQFGEDYDVKIFSGFQNVTEDKKLNAIVLGKENIEAKVKLESLEKKLTTFMDLKESLDNKIKSLEWNDIYKDEGIEKHALYRLKEEKESSFNSKSREIDNFYQKKARELKEYTNPQITKTSYNKNDFLEDIPNSKQLDETEIEQYEQILNETSKDEVKNKYKIEDINFEELIDELNEILIYKVKEVTFVKEIQDNPDRKTFAQKGLELHEAGENCSFCGNEIKMERIDELESFVSASEVNEFQERITNQITNIKNLTKQLEEIKEIKKDDFYSSFDDEIERINTNIKIKIDEYKGLLKVIQDKLNDKNISIFKSIKKITIDIPDNFSKIKKEINELIDSQNEWTKNIENKQTTAKNKLRLHYVALNLLDENYKKGWRGYKTEQNELALLEEQFKDAKENIISEVNKIKGSTRDPKENTIEYLIKEIEKGEEQKSEILEDTKSTYRLVEIINRKLKSAGKDNLELTLVKGENDIEHYQVKDGKGVRSIERLSTGEKNIIAFLYFLESLSDVETKSDKNKIIIFDDPMNSNDDTMQYLIITEIQKLYTNKYLDKLNLQKDYFVCLTHNAHFYLNVQPQGNFKEEKIINGKKKKVSKYDKNQFYRIENRRFNHILSQKDDFNTHYESLWIELKELYTNNLLNSTLNSMRRIIETYTKFNKINPVKFYHKKEEHKKLFDVNSHSIDDLSMEMIGKSKSELLDMFKDLFESNDAIEHYKTHWGSTMV